MYTLPPEATTLTPTSVIPMRSIEVGVSLAGGGLVRPDADGVRTIETIAEDLQGVGTNLPKTQEEIDWLQGRATRGPETPQDAYRAREAQQELERAGEVGDWLRTAELSSPQRASMAGLNPEAREQDLEEQPEVGPITSHSEEHYL